MATPLIASPQYAPEVKSAEFNDWFSQIYDPLMFSDDDLTRFYDEYQYKGFDRMKVLVDLRKLVNDPKEVVQIVIICALRGPKRAAETKLISGKTISQYRIPASGLKGSLGVSCARISSATADLAAFYLKRMNAPKRLNLDCPAWLQFPAAGSITLPQEFRTQHLEFAKQFSPQIGGVFNESIYMQMMRNSYLNPELGLFNEPVLSPSKVVDTKKQLSSSASARRT